MVLKPLVSLAFVVAAATAVAGQTPASGPVGAIDVSTDQARCAPATDLRLWAVQTAASGAIGRTGRWLGISPDCHWTIGDITPGTYQVDLMLPAGSAGSSALFVVREQETTRVVVAPADTLVAGRVSVSAKPVAGATLEFTPRDRQSGAITGTTGANGRYSVALAHPGQYMIFLRGKSSPTLTKYIDVAAGVNTVDWTIAGGGSVRVKGIRPVLPTTVHIEARRAPHNGDLAPGDEPVLTKDGLDFDAYSVSATPVCRTVPLNGTIYVELNAGRRVEALWPRDLTPAVIQSAMAALSDVPGSDCPVPLADFSPVNQPPSALGQLQLMHSSTFQPCPGLA